MQIVLDIKLGRVYIPVADLPRQHSGFVCRIGSSGRGFQAILIAAAIIAMCVTWIVHVVFPATNESAAIAAKQPSGEAVRHAAIATCIVMPMLIWYLLDAAQVAVVLLIVLLTHRALARAGGGITGSSGADDRKRRGRRRGRARLPPQHNWKLDTVVRASRPALVLALFGADRQGRQACAALRDSVQRVSHSARLRLEPASRGRRGWPERDHFRTDCSSMVSRWTSK